MLKTKKGDQWFKSWFDTKYYHLLYKNRDYSEAKLFLDNLLLELNPPKSKRLLDLACGKGRHSIYLASKGLNVVGMDLSKASIKEANKSATKKLAFYTHDMRQKITQGKFDFILNLFTSFGYFDNEQDHIDTLNHIVKALKKDGTFVIDFINAKKAIANLKKREQKTIQGICFKLNRSVKKGYITKKIKFEDNGKHYQFEEKVRAFTLGDFRKMFKEVGLEIETTYGNYNLKKFNSRTSDRLIIIAKKK